MKPGIDSTLDGAGNSLATPLYRDAELRVNSHTQGAERVASLDALRGLMALSVAVYHLHTWTHVFGRGTKLSSAVAVLGLFSVQGFFIVSGFCFFHLYREAAWSRAALTRFHVRRFFRIAPLYYVAVLLNLVLRQPVADQFTWVRFAENMTLTFGLVHPNHAFVIGGWSIGVEYVFYLVFPLLALATRRRVALYGAAVLGTALALWFTFHVVAEAPELARFNAYVRIANHGFLFLLGGVIADLRTRTSFRLSARAFGLGVVALSALFWVRQPAFWDHFEAVLGWTRAEHLAQVFALSLLFAFYVPPAKRWVTPFTFLGDLSYAVYLLHPFAYLAVDKLLPGAGYLTRFGLGLAATFALATLSYRALEKPMIQLARRLTS